jgi:hypothetical protein
VYSVLRILYVIEYSVQRSLGRTPLACESLHEFDLKLHWSEVYSVQRRVEKYQSIHSLLVVSYVTGKLLYFVLLRRSKFVHVLLHFNFHFIFHILLTL